MLHFHLVSYFACNSWWNRMIKFFIFITISRYILFKKLLSIIFIQTQIHALHLIVQDRCLNRNKFCLSLKSTCILTYTYYYWNADHIKYFEDIILHHISSVGILSAEVNLSARKMENYYWRLGYWQVVEEQSYR